MNQYVFGVPPFCVIISFLYVIVVRLLPQPDLTTNLSSSHGLFFSLRRLPSSHIRVVYPILLFTSTPPEQHRAAKWIHTNPFLESHLYHLAPTSCVIAMKLASLRKPGGCTISPLTTSHILEFRFGRLPVA